MFDAAQLTGFVLAVFVLVLVPGPNTIIILAQSAAGGRIGGLATVAGVETGTVVHTLAAAVGLSALLSASPVAFSAVTVSGGAYLVIAGWKMLRERTMELRDTLPALPPSVAYKRALITNVLNPKSGLFFLAFLPQFVNTERGAVFLQFLFLGLIVSIVGGCFGSALALAAGSLTEWLQRNASFARWQQRVAGGVLVCVGIALAARSWPG